jgi:hypothetical protein
LGHYIDYGTPESSDEEFESDDEGQQTSGKGYGPVEEQKTDDIETNMWDAAVAPKIEKMCWTE